MNVTEDYRLRLLHISTDIYCCLLFVYLLDRAVNKRFGRLESHVVTLARSVAHLSSELRSQASISQDMDDMRRQVHVQQCPPDTIADLARESALLQSRVKKLRRYVQLTLVMMKTSIKQSKRRDLTLK